MDDTTGRVARRDTTDDTDQRTQEIREEIAQTRVEMSETIEAIQERLTPSHLVAQAGETVRNATTEKVKQMANTAGQAAEQVMDTSFVQTVRANPIPAAMIGIGAAWLLLKGRSDSPRGYRSRDYRYRTSGAYGSTGDYGTGASAPGSAYGASGAYDAGQRDWRVGTPESTAVGTTGYSEYASGSAGASSRVPEFGGEMRNYSRAQSVSFDRVVRDNPLVVGAAAALVGVAIGMSLPASETENKLMGEARDSVVDRARDLAGDAAEKVKDVAGKAVEAATDVRDAAQKATGTTVGSANITGREIGSTPGAPRTPRSSTRRTSQS